MIRRAFVAPVILVFSLGPAMAGRQTPPAATRLPRTRAENPRRDDWHWQPHRHPATGAERQGGHLPPDGEGARGSAPARGSGNASAVLCLVR